jgi:hypothetical protein
MKMKTVLKLIREECVNYRAHKLAPLANTATRTPAFDGGAAHNAKVLRERLTEAWNTISDFCEPPELDLFGNENETQNQDSSPAAL